VIRCRIGSQCKLCSLLLDLTTNQRYHAVESIFLKQVIVLP